jgi:hypothetical protein
MFYVYLRTCSTELQALYHNILPFLSEDFLLSLQVLIFVRPVSSSSANVAWLLGIRNPVLHAQTSYFTLCYVLGIMHDVHLSSSSLLFELCSRESEKGLAILSEARLEKKHERIAIPVSCGIKKPDEA